MSYTGAHGRIHSRNPANGINRISAEVFLDGEGSSLSFLRLKRSLPSVAAQLEEKASQLEKEHRDAVTFEFRWSDEDIRIAGVSPLNRESDAAITISVNLVKEGLISREEALRRVTPLDVDKLLAPVFSSNEIQRLSRSERLLLRGRGEGLGVATGIVALDAASAYKFHREGKPVVLVCPRLTYRQRDLLPIISGFVVAEGPVQAALLFEKPGVVARQLALLTEGMEVSIDSGSGCVFQGRLDVLPGNMNSALMTLLSWADEARTMELRANATTPQEVEYARALGATGVGLCRIETLFQQPGRLPLFAQVLSDVCVHETYGAAPQKALEAEIQTGIEALFRAAGCDRPPFILRLLDAPVSQMLRFWRDGGYMPARYFDALLESWTHELNPLGGLRFGRLSIIYPELLRLQLRAILKAQTVHPVRLQLMMPGVADAREVLILRQEVEALATELGVEIPMLGSMLETPRACLTIDELVREGEFYSFGTGDLTESTCGLSRYDAPLSFLPRYVEQGIFQRDPFEVLDQKGVGALMRQAVTLARKENPSVELGTCGAQAAEESGMKFCCRIGLDYVSVPMHRLPAARLAAARAALELSSGS